MASKSSSKSAAADEPERSETSVPVYGEDENEPTQEELEAKEAEEAEANDAEAPDDTARNVGGYSAYDSGIEPGDIPVEGAVEEDEVVVEAAPAEEPAPE
jgi:hypothetical protein